MGNEEKKGTSSLGSFNILYSNLGVRQGRETEQLKSRSHFQERWAVLRTKVPVYPWSLGASLQAGIYIRVFPRQLPWAAKHGYTQCLTMLSPVFGTLLCPRVLPPRHPKASQSGVSELQSGSVYLSAVLPWQEALSHHRPARSSPVSCSILPGLPCFFLLPSPCPTAVRPCLHFCLLPSFLSLPVPPRARSLLHPPREAPS